MNSPSKKIAIFSDGTGNDYHRTPSNVIRLYRWTSRRHGQMIYYHPGVGTLDLPEGRTRIGRRIRHWRELGLGTGLIENVIAHYAYLMRHYEPGDEILLFGFSRGAFAARALAGMLHVCGLLHRYNEHLLPYAGGLYRTSQQRIRQAVRRMGSRYAPRDTDPSVLDEKAQFFKREFARECPIRFMGLWDSVDAYGWVSPQSFPAIRLNPSVRAVRHALALDERRPVFHVRGWGHEHFVEERGDSDPIQEVWFSGDHSDVGGGHDCGNTSLTDASLGWMVGEAVGAGLVLEDGSHAQVKRIVENGNNAPSVSPSDLRKQFWYTYVLPRTALDMSTYPPRRRPAWFWADGARHPERYGGGNPILVHETVLKRDRAYVMELRQRMSSYPGTRKDFELVRTRDCADGVS